MNAPYALPSAELIEFGGLVDRVYQGATDPSKWPGILPALADWVSAHKLVLLTPTKGIEIGGFLFTHNVSESTNELWRAKWRSDLWANGAVARGLMFEGNVGFGQEVVPTAQLVESDWYKQFLHHAGILYVMWGAVFGVESRTSPLVTCSAFRDESGSEFGAVEKARMQLILPHLSRALGVMLRLQDAEFKTAASLAALDRLSAAVALIGEHGRLVFANRAAQRIFAEEDGLKLRAPFGAQSQAELLADATPDAQAALARALREAIDEDILATAHFSRALPIARHSGRAPYVAQFSRLPLRNEYGNAASAPRAIVFFSDPAEPLAVNRQMLSETYGLTPAEVRATETIVNGGTVQEVAGLLGVSENTVRTQLKQIYAKTGVDSRARLVKLVYSLSSP